MSRRDAAATWHMSFKPVGVDLEVLVLDQVVHFRVHTDTAEANAADADHEDESDPEGSSEVAADVSPANMGGLQSERSVMRREVRCPSNTGGRPQAKHVAVTAAGSAAASEGWSH